MPSPRLLQAFSRHVQEQPDSTALVASGERVTYAELERLTRLAAADLDGAGFGFVRALCVPAHKSPETIALLLAAWRQGINTLVPSPSLGAAALATLTAQAHGPLTATAVPGGGVILAREETDPALADGFVVPDPAESLLTLTTSGSTGVPKLVPIRTEAFDRFADWATGKFGLDGSTRALSFSPLNFDLALLDVWTVLEAGGTVVLADAGASGDAGYLRELALAHEVTLVQGVPLLHRLLAADGARYPAVRTVVFTGEAVSEQGLRDAFAACPGARFHNVFGCTETNDSFIEDIDPDAYVHPLPIGTPIDGTHAVLLIDGPGGTEVLQGPGTGELLVHTPSRPAATSNRPATPTRSCPTRAAAAPCSTAPATSSTATPTAATSSRAVPTSRSRCAACAPTPWRSRPSSAPTRTSSRPVSSPCPAPRPATGCTRKWCAGTGPPSARWDCGRTRRSTCRATPYPARSGSPAPRCRRPRPASPTVTRSRTTD